MSQEHNRETNRELAKLERHYDLFAELWNTEKPERAIAQARNMVSHGLYSAKELVEFARETIQQRETAMKNNSN